MHLTDYFMPASSGHWAAAPLEYIYNDSMSFITAQNNTQFVTTSLVGNLGHTLIVRTIATFAVSFFSILDALYHTTACLVKLPLIAIKPFVELVGANSSFPSTLTNAEVYLHITRAAKSVIMIATSFFVGSFNPEIVAAMASRIGYVSTI